MPQKWDIYHNFCGKQGILNRHYGTAISINFATKRCFPRCSEKEKAGYLEQKRSQSTEAKVIDELDLSQIMQRLHIFSPSPQYSSDSETITNTRSLFVPESHLAKAKFGAKTQSAGMHFGTMWCHGIPVQPYDLWHLLAIAAVGGVT